MALNTLRRIPSKTPTDRENLVLWEDIEKIFQRFNKHSHDGKNSQLVDSDSAVTSAFGRVGVVVAEGDDYTWAQIDKSTSDLADLTTKSHTDLDDIGAVTHADLEIAVGLNTAKDTNVPTALSVGTRAATTLAITSDGGADDVVLPEADTDEAGLLSAVKWDEIVANTTHGGLTNNPHAVDASDIGDIEGLSTSFTAGSIPFSDGSNLAEDNDELFWDNVNKVLGLGTTTPNSLIPSAKLLIHDDDGTNSDIAAIISDSDGDSFPAYIMGYSRGTKGSPAIVEAGDILGRIEWRGYDGTDFDSIGAMGVQIYAQVIGTPAEDDIDADLYIHPFGLGLIRGVKSMDLASGKHYSIDGTVVGETAGAGIAISAAGVISTTGLESTGLIPIAGTFTFASTTTYTNSGNTTYGCTINVDSGAATIYNVNMWIKLTQSTGGIKWGKITAIADTLLTIFLGEDYTLVDEEITVPFYSGWAHPIGSPTERSKYSILLSDGSARNQATPTINVWYNLGTTNSQINMPLWDWDLDAHGGALWYLGADAAGIEITISNANNTEAFPQFTFPNAMDATRKPGANLASKFGFRLTGSFTLVADDVLYLNMRAMVSGITDISFRGSEMPTIVCFSPTSW